MKHFIVLCFFAVIVHFSQGIDGKKVNLNRFASITQDDIPVIKKLKESLAKMSFSSDAEFIKMNEEDIWQLRMFCENIGLDIEKIQVDKEDLQIKDFQIIKKLKKNSLSKPLCIDDLNEECFSRSEILFFLASKMVVTGSLQSPFRLLNLFSKALFEDNEQSVLPHVLPAESENSSKEVLENICADNDESGIDFKTASKRLYAIIKSTIGATAIQEEKGINFKIMLQMVNTIIEKEIDPHVEKLEKIKLQNEKNNKKIDIIICCFLSGVASGAIGFISGVMCM